MAKKILGDNPFDDAGDAGKRDTGASPAQAEGSPEVPVHGAAAAAVAAGTEADQETGQDAGQETGQEADQSTGAYTPEPMSAVPDAAVPDEVPGGRGADFDELFLGGEAAVPPGEYGPPIESVLPPIDAQTGEFRELERRMQAHLTPAFPIEQRRRLPLEFLWKRYRRFAMRDRSDTVDDFGRDPVYAAGVQPALDFLYRRYFRVDTSGIENVPDTGRVLLVANHSGMLPYDGAMVMHAMHREHPARRDVRPLVEDFVFHFPYLGTFINRIGGVRACQANAERLLARNQVIVVFPEGIKGMGKLYRQRYQLQRFGRGGFIKLALRTRSPIIPVAIVGAEEAHPMLAKLTWLSQSAGIPYVPITPTFPLLGPLGLMPLPVKWTVRFGPPIDIPGDYGPEAASERLLVNELAESVRSRIQGMVDDILSQRKSVLFG